MIHIPIISSFDSKGIKKAVKEFNNFKKSSDKFSYVLKRSAIPAIAGVTAGLGSLAAISYVAVKAAAADERSQKLLADQLIRSTHATDTVIKANETFISSMSYATGTADDKLRPAMSRLVAATGNVTYAQELLTLALDISTATGLDLESVSVALGKAYLGNYMALTKLGVPIDETAKKTKNFAEIQKELNTQFGGAAGKAADTFAGVLARTNVAYNEMKEAIGKVLLNALKPFVDFMSAHGIPALKVFTDNLGEKGIGASAKMAIASMNTFAITFINQLEIMSLTVLNFIQHLSNVGKKLALVGAVAAGLAGDVVGVLKLGAASILLGKADDALSESIKNLPGQFAALRAEILALQGQMSITTGIHMTADALERAAEAYAKLHPKVKEIIPPVGAAGSAFDSFAKKVKDGVLAVLDTAKTKLDDAKAAFKDFAESVASTLKSGLDFGKLGRETTGKDFFGGLFDQVEGPNGIVAFTDVIKQLISAGLSKDALQEVLDAGSEAGLGIGRVLIEGGATAITETNRLVEAATQAAATVSNMAATKWYQSGIDQAQKMVDGIQIQLDKLTPKLMDQMDKIAKGLARTVDVTVRITEAVTRVVTTVGSTPLTPGGLVGVKSSSIRSMSVPTRTSGATTNIYVSGVLSEAGAGTAIVSALRRMNQITGPINIQVA